MKVLARLSEFYDLIKVFRSVKEKIIDGLEVGKLSSRLKTLVDKEFPDYDPIIEEFEKMIVWKKASGRRIPEPKPGVDEHFDKCNEDVIDMKEKLQEYIDEVTEEH